MKSICICIPCYNSEKTIRHALDSLLSQTFQDFEIIVSDNYSTDRTRDIIESEYLQKGVKLITCKLLPFNNGDKLDNCYSAAQNWSSLIELTKSKYIGIYHADDIYDSDIIRKQVETFLKFPETSVVFTLPKYIDESNSFINISNSEKKLESFYNLSQTEFIKELAINGHFFSSSGVLISRSKWRKSGSFDAFSWGHQFDTEFWIRLSERGKVIILNEELVMHRLHSGQETSKWKEIYKFEYLPIIRLLEFHLTKNKLITDNESIYVLNFYRFKIKETMRVSINLLNEHRFEDAKMLIYKDFNLNILAILKKSTFYGYRVTLKVCIFSILKSSFKLQNNYFTNSINFLYNLIN